MTDQQIYIWTTIFVTLVVCWLLYLVARSVKRGLAARREGDWDFGEYGVLVRRPDGSYSPIDLDDLMSMEQETQAAIDEFWFRHELRAVQLYGDAILRPQ